MALYRLEVEVIQRSDGRSVIAAAAYRSASRIHDQRLEMIFDYEAKRGVERVGVMAPDVLGFEPSEPSAEVLMLQTS